MSMKKFILSVKLLTVLSVIIVGFSSCQKSSSGGGSLNNGFRVDGTTYEAKSSMRGMLGANSIQFFDVPIASLATVSTYNTLAIAFNNTQGIAAGTYKVAATDDVSTLVSGEIAILIATGMNSNGSTVGVHQYLKDISSSTIVNATVTINGGKVTVVMSPSPFMGNLANGGASTLTQNTVEVNITEL